MRILVGVVCLLLARLVIAQTQFPQGEFPLTDYQRSSVDFSEILSGGPPRDGIPPVDNPKFIDVDAASQWLAGNEPVAVVSVSNHTRAYPLQIMMYHEIVNDQLGDTPVAVTFCPLCNASIAFERQVELQGKTTVLDFGTTGRLRLSDLVMYDRQTESWWQQFTGRGIIGEYTDVKLNSIPSQIVSFDTFKQTYPEAQVLSRETGYSRQYGNNPYRGYDSIDNNPFLFRGDIDPRLPAMERILAVPSGEQNTLIPLSSLQDVAVQNLKIGGEAVALFSSTNAASALDAGRISESRPVPAAAAFLANHDGMSLQFSWQDGQIVDQQTGSQWNVFGQAVSGTLQNVQLQQLDSGVHFAFAWLAFDPDAIVFKGN